MVSQLLHRLLPCLPANHPPQPTSEGSKKTDVADKWSKTLNWYLFVVTNYFLYGESIIYYFKHIIFVDAVFIPFARNHRFISFMLYVMGKLARGPFMKSRLTCIQALLASWPIWIDDSFVSNSPSSAGFTSLFSSLWCRGE